MNISTSLSKVTIAVLEKKIKKEKKRRSRAVTLSDRCDRGCGCRTRADRTFRTVAGVVRQAGVHRGRLLLDDVG